MFIIEFIFSVLIVLASAQNHSETTGGVVKVAPPPPPEELQIETINVDTPPPKGVNKEFYKQFLDVFKVCIPNCAPKIQSVGEFSSSRQQHKNMMCVAKGLGVIIKSISCPEYSHQPNSKKFRYLKGCLVKSNFNVSERGLFIVSKKRCSE